MKQQSTIGTKLSGLRLFERPSPGSLAEKVVRRLEEEEVTLHQANNLLMREFGRTRNADAYSVLYQINYRLFLNIISRKVHGYLDQINPADVLQDVFIYIYRYPSKFRVIHDRSFANWSYSIINNTIREQLRKLRRRTISLDAFPEAFALPSRFDPVARLICKDDIERTKRTFCLLLIMYANIYRTALSKKEKRALHMVEVQRMPYPEAAEKLGIRYGNFKVTVSRARRKIVNRICLLANRSRAFELEKKAC